MFDTDFSRIRELFYQEVSGEESEINLKKFIKHAFVVYNKKYAKIGGKIRQISYPSTDRKNTLSLLVTAPYNLVDLTGLQIDGETNTLPPLLRLLRGSINAEFSDLNLEKVAKPIKQEAAKDRREHYMQAGTLGLYFSLNPQNPNLVKRAILQQCKKRLLSKKFTNATLEEAVLDEETMKLISAADHVGVRNSSYICNDPNKDLIHESCNIIQPEKGKYLWAYNVCVANNQGLPADIFSDLNNLFELVKDKFGALSFQRMSIKDPAQRPIVGVDLYE